MRRLYLLRHGIAVPHGDPAYRDDDRPLTPKGEARIRTLAKGLIKLGVEVDRVVTSPLPRAVRTAEIVTKGLDIADRLEVDDALRSGVSPESVRDWLDARPEDSLMIVGHNPTFSDLLALLLGASVAATPFELGKGGLAALEAISPRSYQLKWLASPGLFRRLLG